MPTSQPSQGQKQLRDRVLVYVRLPSKNKSDLMPGTGCSITLEWHTPGFLTRKHIKGGERWPGVVVTREAREFQEPETDFCVCLRMPSGAEPQVSHKKQLPLAYLDVAHNLNPIWREQEATKTTWKSTRKVHLAVLNTLALDEATAKAVQAVIDLSEGHAGEDGMDD